MKICAQWILKLLPWLDGVSTQELKSRMSVLGHNVTVTDTAWDFVPSQERNDLASAIGIAREISAAFGKEADIPTPEVADEDIGSIFEQVDADVWSETVCNRITAKLAIGLKSAKTPQWMKTRLSAAGICCSDTVQDIANYVALEYGQPVLLLDAKSICDGSVTLRESMGYEIADEQELSYGLPVLESGEALLAVPHYWCGAEAAVDSSTKDILILAAHYPDDVLSLCDESFCKVDFGKDPLLTITAVERTAQLIQQLGYGRILDGALDVLNFVPNPVKLDISKAYALCNTLSWEDFKTLLSLMGIAEDGTIPSWRTDLDTIEALQSAVSRLHRANTLTNDIFSV